MNIFKRDWLFGYNISNIEGASNIYHKIKADFKYVLVNSYNVPLDNLVLYVERFHKDYKIFIKISEEEILFYMSDIDYDRWLHHIEMIISMGGHISGVIFEFGGYKIDDKTSAQYKMTSFLKRMKNMAKRYGLQLYVMSGSRIRTENKYPLSSLIRTGREEGVNRGMDLLSYHLRANHFLKTFIVGDSGRFGNEFKVVSLTGVDKNGKEVALNSDLNIYTMKDYVTFLKKFKKDTIFFFTGVFVDVSEFKSNLIKLL